MRGVCGGEGGALQGGATAIGAAETCVAASAVMGSKVRRGPGWCCAEVLEMDREVDRESGWCACRPGDTASHSSPSDSTGCPSMISNSSNSPLVPSEPSVTMIPSPGEDSQSVSLLVSMKASVTEVAVSELTSCELTCSSAASIRGLNCSAPTFTGRSPPSISVLHPEHQHSLAWPLVRKSSTSFCTLGDKGSKAILLLSMLGAAAVVLNRSLATLVGVHGRGEYTKGYRDVKGAVTKVEGEGWKTVMPSDGSA